MFFTRIYLFLLRDSSNYFKKKLFSLKKSGFGFGFTWQVPPSPRYLSSSLDRLHAEVGANIVTTFILHVYPFWKLLTPKSGNCRFGSVRFGSSSSRFRFRRFGSNGKYHWLFSGTDVLGDFPGGCCFLEFLVRMFWGIFQASMHRWNHAHRVDLGVLILLVKFLPQTDEIRPQLCLFYGSTGSVLVTGSSGSGSFMTRFPVPSSVRTFPAKSFILNALCNVF